MTMTITCATYNILHGRYKEMILENVRLLIKEGVDVFCLQETSTEFEKEVLHFLQHGGFKHWRAEFVHKGAGGHVGLLWNANKLSLTKSTVILLPSLGHRSGLQRLRGHKEIFQRVALLGQFRCHGKRVNVVSTHLAWEGGVVHRFKQIRALRESLAHYKTDGDIVGGDFNTIGPKIAARLQKRPIEKMLGVDFKNVHPHVEWSFDTSFGDPLDKWKIAEKFRRAGIKWRSRLDYMFCRNLRILKADMYDLPGSDHRPLVATFELAHTKAKKVLL